jgi:hypothetical protein
MWLKLPYWVKGGITAVVMYCVFLAIHIYRAITCTGFLCDFNALENLSFPWFSFEYTSQLMHEYAGIILLLINTVIILFVGALIGGIYGKIKSLTGKLPISL